MAQSLLQARENLEWMCRSAWNKVGCPLSHSARALSRVRYCHAWRDQMHKFRKRSPDAPAPRLVRENAK